MEARLARSISLCAASWSLSESHAPAGGASRRHNTPLQAQVLLAADSRHSHGIHKVHPKDAGQPRRVPAHLRPAPFVRCLPGR